MMRSTFAARLFLLSMLIVGWNASTAIAADAPPALVSAGRNLLEWTPAVDFESITLSLADPQGLVRTHRFGPGEAPALSLFDAQGMPLPDGTYTWELRGTPRRSAGRPITPLVQSGYFTISGGSLVASDLTEPPEKIITSEDQMVPDDLIVDGKGCIGLGCANNEAFFSEALRLKQSVVRLRFEDTSTTAGLPARDWQLTINDSASGGADRFSIDDLTAGTTPFTVRGGAPSNSLYVDGVGNVGLGTSTPAQELTIKSRTANQNVVEVRRSQADSQVIMRVFETTSGAGLMSFFDDAGNEDFRLTGSGGHSWFSGTVGLNCNNPAGWDFSIKSGFGSSTACNTGTFSVIDAGQTQFTVSSSRTIKQNIVRAEVPDILEKINNVGVYTYDFIEGPKGRLGLMAEDFHQVFGRGSDKLLNGQEVEMAMWLAVQELTARNNELVERVEIVEEQRQLIEKQQELIGQLEERLRRLETRRSMED